MDKRYGLILIIFIVCIINLISIVDVSDVVGSASAECGDFIFSLPEGFTLYDSNPNQVLIRNSDGIEIYVYSKIDRADTYDAKIKEIESKGYTIISNGTIDVGGINVKSVYYNKTDDDHQNRSTFFFTKDNNRFRILVMDFNMANDKNKTIDYVSTIIDSLKVNYKK
ncbi:hypothetical protein [uncultured Methanobrevibacter sp.]|uniref:hypothetical protein n=1 Tax=uncultured Methanobrevibacter sp. TaxID=253161 RepID=UPI0025D75627|nr:hypothetical protein [uncultured Methanobrevibacter sp.]